LRKKQPKQQKKSVLDATNKLLPETLYLGFKNRLKPKTKNQHDYIRNISEHDITFCQGVAGSGKTHIAMGVALEYLLDGKVDRIIITRPVVESGERIGYLPGTAEEKLHPYLLPILDEINYFITMTQYASLKINNKIEIVPLGLMRGRNFHKCFIVADECQNASYDQLKMLLTRLGNESKMVLTGDVSQSDLHYNIRGGFNSMMLALSDLDGVAISHLDFSDIVRNPIISSILKCLEHYESQER
jgi:phosphate starvation-inducible protein PhoH and related proteins